jgi:UDP-4-amino-4,6-dideoxy-N-acetyl-beta-L-altrosamine N-acetyltransferase
MQADAREYERLMNDIVRMRDVQPSDKEQLRVWRNSPAVARNSMTSHVITPEAQERWFASAMSDPTRLYWIITCDGTDMGLINLYNIDHVHRHAHMSVYLGTEAHQAHGVGLLAERWLIEYCFNQLELHKICGEIMAFNLRGLERHKWMGFRDEGLLRQHAFRDGQFHDVWCVGMLKEDWESRQAEVMPVVHHVVDRLQRRRAARGCGDLV